MQTDGSDPSLIYHGQGHSIAAHSDHTKLLILSNAVAPKGYSSKAY